MKLITLYLKNSPASLSAIFELCQGEYEFQHILEESETIINKQDILEGTLTEDQIDELQELIITSFQCGATIKVKITKEYINPVDISYDYIIKFFNFSVKDEDIKYDYIDIKSECFGYELHKLGKYYILLAGDST